MKNLALGAATLLLAACTHNPIPTPFGNLAILHQGELGLYRVNSPAQPPKADANAQHDVPARSRSIPQAFRGNWFIPDNSTSLQQQYQAVCPYGALVSITAKSISTSQGSFATKTYPKHYSLYADNQIRGTARTHYSDIGAEGWENNQQMHMYLNNNRL